MIKTFTLDANKHDICLDMRVFYKGKDISKYITVIKANCVCLPETESEEFIKDCVIKGIEMVKEE